MVSSFKITTYIGCLLFAGSLSTAVSANSSFYPDDSNQPESVVQTTEFSIVDSYRAGLDHEFVFSIIENGDPSDETKVRETIQDADGFYYTVDELNNWVKYELSDKEGVLVHSIRNGEFNSTIVFSDPWLMIPAGMQEGETYSATVDFDLYYKKKSARDGSLEWSITYNGMQSIKTDLQTFDNVHALSSTIEIDFPYKFGLAFDQVHYFDSEHGEVYRTIDGDATFIGIGIKDRKVVESLKQSNEITSEQQIELIDRVESNVEGIEVNIALGK